MDDPTAWGGIWLAAAALLGIGEMATAGSFWLAPFAIAAVAAAIVSFLGAPVALGWLVFLAISVLAFLGMRPLARRLDLDVPDQLGIGSNRLIGHVALVVEEIPAGIEVSGMVKAGGETWNAMSATEMALPVGTEVNIVEVKGTRVIVEPSPESGLDRYL